MPQAALNDAVSRISRLEGQNAHIHPLGQQTSETQDERTYNQFVFSIEQGRFWPIRNVFSFSFQTESVLVVPRESGQTTEKAEKTRSSSCHNQSS